MLRPNDGAQPPDPELIPTDSMRLLAVLTAFALAATASTAHAGWGRTPTGAPIVTAIGDQHRPAAVADGEGGAFLVFADLRAGGYDIYAQRINRAGNRVWGANGVPVCTAPGLQDMPRLVLDGSGGVVVTWEDHRGSAYDVYAQRLDATGNRLWATDGELVCGANGDQVDPALTPDGAGGAFVAWTDFRGGATSDVYAQHVDGSGVSTLAPNGVALAAVAFDQDGVQLCPDGAGGAFAVWNDFRNGANSDLYVARLTAGGTLPWGAGGLVLGGGTGDQIGAVLTADASGGALLAWSDLRAGNSDIYAQRIDAAGAHLWTPTGEAVCTASNDQSFPVILHDGADGAFFAWEDARMNNDNIYAQHFAGDAWRLWQLNGIAVCTATGAQLEPQMVRDTTGGVILCWQDQRSGGVDIYAQHVSAEGAPDWNGDGIALCNASAAQLYPALVPDGTGGAIAVWEDSRNLLVDLYAQRVLEGGTLGASEPVITAITDVPDDGGLHVTITWNASLYESPTQQIDRYRLWRRPPGGTWELAVEKDPTTAASYVLTSTTTADSTPNVTTLRTQFMLEALATDGVRSWWSPPDSGLSIDTQAPAMPVGFLVLDIGGGWAHAQWRANSEPDIEKYLMYTGMEPWFEPNEFTFRHTITSNEWTFEFVPSWWVKLVAVDQHGNQSDPASAQPEVSVGVGESAPKAAFLAPASPNPARESSTLRFGLSRESDVDMRLFDQQGRQVGVLASGRLPAGQHAALWTGRDATGRRAAPGVYFVRAKLEGREFTQRVVLVK